MSAASKKTRLLRWTTLSAASSCLVATAALLALGASSGTSRALASTLQTSQGEIDIELAFDTTRSMRPSIDQAKRDGANIVARVREAFPTAHFAVVSFRDYGNPSGDYAVLQPMTGDVGAVQAGLAKLQTASNPSPLNTAAEEYNLALQRSYTDAAIAWRRQARKVVVVMGDGEPHSAGKSGIQGCKDTSTDYYGLNTADVLAGMRAAERTLLMVRQVSSETSASLGCYSAMAERAYDGGAARNGGDLDLAGPILALLQNAVAPIALRPDLGVALRGGTAGYTATVSNPNPFALSLRSVEITLPVGFRHRSASATGARLSGSRAPTKVNLRIERVIRPSQKVSVHFRVRVPMRRGRYSVPAVARLQLPGGKALESTGGASLRVTPRLRSLVVAARAQKRLNRSGTASLRAGVRIAFRPGARTLRTGKLLSGHLVLRGPRRSLVFSVRSHRVVSVGSPAVLRLGLKLERAHGMPGCSPGARGSATIVDDEHFNAAGLRRDTVATSFRVKCRIGTSRWMNVGASRSAVTTTAR